MKGVSRESGKHHGEEGKLKYEFPPIRCIVVVISSILCAMAWIFTIFVGWERYSWLKQLCLVPLAILLLVFLPAILKKVRHMGEWHD